MTALADVDDSQRVIGVTGPESTPFARLARLSYFGRLIRKVQLQLSWRWDHRHDDADALEFPPTDFGVVEENPVITRLTDLYLSQLTREIRATGAELVLMAVPSRDYSLRGEARPPGLFHDEVRRWAARARVSFLDLAGPFAATAATDQLFFRRDIHSTEAGHAVVTAAILDAYPHVFRE